MAEGRNAGSCAKVGSDTLIGPVFGEWHRGKRVRRARVQVVLLVRVGPPKWVRLVTRGGGPAGERVPADWTALVRLAASCFWETGFFMSGCPSGLSYSMGRWAFRHRVEASDGRGRS